MVQGTSLGETRGHPRSEFFISAPKIPQTQPHVLSREEVARLLGQTEHRRDRALLMTTYAAGLRVSEVVVLKVTDLESDRMLIRFEQGKGAKDRYTLLTERLLSELRTYWRVVRPPLWLFPGAGAECPLTKRTAERIYTRAALASRVTGTVPAVVSRAFGTGYSRAGWSVSSSVT